MTRVIVWNILMVFWIIPDVSRNFRDIEIVLNKNLQGTNLIYKKKIILMVEHDLNISKGGHNLPFLGRIIQISQAQLEVWK